MIISYYYQNMAGRFIAFHHVSSFAMAHVVFVALGSRGDVQPLAVLATQLAQTRRAQVSLVSPWAMLQKWLGELVSSWESNGENDDLMGLNHPNE